MPESAIEPTTERAVRAPMGRWPALVAFLVPFALTIVICLVRNSFLFSVPIHEGADLAADSLLVNKATHLRLLLGNYSRVGFYHPGPGLFYVLGAGQALFFSLLHLVPSPMNGQMLGGVVFAATCLGLCSLATLRLTRSRTATTLVMAVLLWFATQTQMLNSVWPPNLNLASFTLLVIAGAAVAAGSTADLPTYVVAGGLLVHGHVSFVMFVGVTTLVVLISWSRCHRARRRDELRRHRLAIGSTVAILGLLVLPIVLETALHWPGMWGRYWHYLRSGDLAPRSIADVVRFVSYFWTHAPVASWLIGLAVIAAIALVATERNLDRRRAFGLLYAMVAVQTLLFTFYAWRGVDALTAENRYLGTFYRSVPVILLAFAAAHTTLRAGAALARRSNGAVRLLVGATVALAGFIVAAAATGDAVTNVDRGRPAYADAARVIAESTQRDGRAVAIDFPVTPAMFLDGGGVVIDLERRGIPWCIRNPYWGLSFLEENLCPTAEGAWVVDVLPPEEAAADDPNVVYRSDTFIVRQDAP